MIRLRRLGMAALVLPIAFTSSLARGQDDEGCPDDGTPQEVPCQSVDLSTQEAGVPEPSQADDAQDALVSADGPDVLSQDDSPLVDTASDGSALGTEPTAAELDAQVAAAGPDPWREQYDGA